MTQMIALPLWLFWLLLLLSGWLLAERLLLPRVRALLRGKLNNVIAEVNSRLKLQIQPFKLTRRQSLIDLLTYDPKVMEIVAQVAEAEGLPREAVLAQVQRYAREIVPSFNAYIYFRIGYRLARGLARALYRVRLGYVDEDALNHLDPQATVVFVINHRSNMDYVLVAFLAANHAALSYAVGEWARVWPLQSLIKAMGAYFIRRNSKDPLYRRVLERYVYMATQNGVTQALFPEGGLSRDGALRPPKMGLVDYMLRSFDPKGGRDLVFIPVALNYDRVMEDRSLIRTVTGEMDQRGVRFILRTILLFFLKQTRLMLRRRWFRYGYACVNFGAPLSMRSYWQQLNQDPRLLPEPDRQAAIAHLAEILMQHVGRLVPVLPVSLMAFLLLRFVGEGVSEITLKNTANLLITELSARGAHIYIPRRDTGYAVLVGLRILLLRRMAVREGRLIRANPLELPLLRYYALSISHLVPESDLPPALFATQGRD
jgi:glycerol-3-phosphate O-acyltransferase